MQVRHGVKDMAFGRNDEERHLGEASKDARLGLAFEERRLRHAVAQLYGYCRVDDVAVQNNSDDLESLPSHHARGTLAVMQWT